MPIPDAILMQPLMRQRPKLAPQLADLQANIPKGYGRHHTRHVFFQFDPARRLALRAALAATDLTSAMEQLRATEAHRLNGDNADPVSLLFLSHSGYQALGVSPARTPDDPAPEHREPGLSGQVDAMLLVAAKTAAQAEAALQPMMVATALAGAQVIADEIGKALLRGRQGKAYFMAPSLSFVRSLALRPD